MEIPVIVVDDEPTDRYIAKRVLRKSGLSEKVIEVESGDRFLELIDDQERLRRECGGCPPPTLVLLDINMPRVNGFDVLEGLKKRYSEGDQKPTCFVVMMFTSSGNPRDREQALRYEFVKDYVVKPLDPEQVERIATHFAVAEKG